MQTKTKGRVAVAAFSLISLFATGCASNRPLITEDKLGQSGIRTVATTAESRLVIIKSNEPKLKRYPFGDTNAPQFEAFVCAEPPPDVAQRIFEKLDLTAKVSGTNSKVSANADVTLARELAREIAQLSKRSQGVILFRDYSFRLSEASLNGVITTNEFKKALTSGFSNACELVKYELAKNPTLSNTPQNTQALKPESKDSKK